MSRTDDAADAALQARTAAHYDAYPLEFLTPADEAAIRDQQPAPFRRFVEQHLRPGAWVAEVGCGPGRGTLFLTRHKAAVVAVDISYRSLLLARRRAPTGRFVLSTNLALPFEEAEFDGVVSDGVIHHTPNARAAFAENVRIVKPGGLLYLGIYNRRKHYYYLYTLLGGPIRSLESRASGRALLFGTIVPLYWLVHLIKSRGRRTWQGAVHFFYDYFVTPRASFHTREEVCGWAHEEGLELLEYDPSLGNVHVFVFRKPQA
jgi:ubiquinone/menaquinone biosynthesis C-methylase UbiE